MIKKLSNAVCCVSKVAEVDAVASGSFKTSDPDQIKATGYVVKSMEAAMWAFYHTDNFKDGCLRVGKDSS